MPGSHKARICRVVRPITDSHDTNITDENLGIYIREKMVGRPKETVTMSDSDAAGR